MTTARVLVADFPPAPWSVPSSTIHAGRYLMRFARTEADLDHIIRLRYEVYNRELQAGLDRSHAGQRDEDRFDRHFHHLLIEEHESAEVVGTYRLQTGEMAAKTGYACGELFQVESLPDLTRKRAVEIGRACVARPHRTGRVLNLLWRGLANYLAWNRKSVLFGCCSLTSQDEATGLALHRHLEQRGSQHEKLLVMPRPATQCGGAHSPEDLGGAGILEAAPPKIPALFQANLTMGAKVLGPPAIDREFKTIDWLALLDVEELDAQTHSSFFR
jgi:putative hemolysin